MVPWIGNEQHTFFTDEEYLKSKSLSSLLEINMNPALLSKPLLALGLGDHGWDSSAIPFCLNFYREICKILKRD
ncbi:hypothetical protein PanWU01x14_274750 [Parasponia andersonii]|uniref:Uncharacterized protein n=1 Tax=Parasponia andersonii TaxID=3476 RepID=A0A2P5B3B1_PARAD|nr:hypothetical protein PanWU01x14_274750 [Parasponia andersonii]